MSSKVRPTLCKSALGTVLFTVAFACGVPLAAQDEEPAADDAEAIGDTAEESAEEAGPERQILDLSVTRPRNESDRLIAKDCEDANEAGRVNNEIVVCRELGEATDGSWDKEAWEKRYAEKTKGMSTPNTFGIPNHGNSIGFGKVPPPAYIVDFDELPEAPEGSDADRIARGLPPLGRQRELTEEEEKARRERLGLKVPEGPLSAPE